MLTQVTQFLARPVRRARQSERPRPPRRGDVKVPGPLFRRAALLPPPGRVLLRTAIANLEMAGVLFDGLTRWRWFVLLTIAGVLATDYYARPHISIGLAVGWAGGLFVLRQAFLLGSFGPGGVAARLRLRLGEEPGARAYEGLTALFFYHRAYSYTLLVDKTAFLHAEWLKPYAVWLQMVGWGGIGLGLLVNTWAFLAIGRPAYYYLDMYYGRFLQPFSNSRLYRLLQNPMYSVGQLPAYGLALLVGSWPGLAFTVANQVCCYVFYALAEKPHLQALLARARPDQTAPN